MGQYMDQNRNNKKKACSRSNFEKRFGAIDSREPGESASRGHIIRKKKSKTFFTIPYVGDRLAYHQHGEKCQHPFLSPRS